MPIPTDTSCEAEYEDGYIHSETFFDDSSPYSRLWEEIEDDTGRWSWVQTGRNILNDILEGRPEQHHGKMVRFSVFYKDQRHDVNWVDLPDNARPIRFRDGYHTLDQDGSETTGWSGVRFGYQYNNEDGKNIQEVQEL